MGEKIINTISFAQRVMGPTATAGELYTARGCSSEEEVKHGLRGSLSSTSSQKKKKRLKLKDVEILDLYSDALREAEIEADWRGTGSHAGNRGEEQEHRKAIELL